MLENQKSTRQVSFWIRFWTGVAKTRVRVTLGLRVRVRVRLGVRVRDCYYKKKTRKR